MNEMKVSKIPPIFFCLTLIIVSLISPVYAPDDENVVDLTNFPERLGLAFNISTFAAGLLASMIVMLAFILPVAIWSRALMPPFIIGLLVFSFCIAVGWLPLFMLVVIILLVAGMWGSKMKDALT